MQNILALILILVLGYTGAHLLFYKSKFPLGTRYMLFAGSEYLFLGLLLAAAPLSILSSNSIQLLLPAVDLGLGWIGLLFGIQFEWAQLKRIPLRYMGITIIQAVFTFLLVLAGLSIITIFVVNNLSVSGILVLAAIASLSSPTCFVFMRSHLHLSHQIRHLVQYISSLDPIVSIAIFGLIISTRVHLGWLTQLPVYFFLASCIVLIFHLLTRFRISRQELLILTMGLVLFSSGLAEIFGLSPLFLNFVIGLGLINLPSLNHRSFAMILHSQEKPIYIVFLVLAGAIWTPSSTQLSILAAYLVFRLLGKLLGSRLSVSFHNLDFTPPALWGLSLFPQGGMAIAMAVDYLHYYPGEAGHAVLNIVLVATLISHLSGPLATRRGLGALPTK
jgi:hypothetical protein